MKLRSPVIDRLGVRFLNRAKQVHIISSDEHITTIAVDGGVGYIGEIVVEVDVKTGG